MEKFTLYFALADQNLESFTLNFTSQIQNPKSSRWYKPSEIACAESLDLSTPFGFRKAVHRVLPRPYHENKPGTCWVPSPVATSGNGGRSEPALSLSKGWGRFSEQSLGLLGPLGGPFTLLGLRGRDAYRLDMSRIPADLHWRLPVLACQRNVISTPAEAIDNHNSPLKKTALMLRRAQHERENACGARLSAHPEPVEGRAESLFQRADKGGEMPNTKQTSAKVASKAAKILSNLKSSKAVKAIAASDLAQTKKK